MQGSQTPWVMVASSHTEGQLFTPSRKPHQAQTRYAVVLAEYSDLISVPFLSTSRGDGNSDHAGRAVPWTRSRIPLRESHPTQMGYMDLWWRTPPEQRSHDEKSGLDPRRLLRGLGHCAV